MERLTNLPIAASEHALVTNTGFGLSSRGLQGPGEECQDVKTMRLGSFVDLESVASVSFDEENAIFVKCNSNTYRLAVPVPCCARLCDFEMFNGQQKI